MKAENVCLQESNAAMLQMNTELRFEVDDLNQVVRSVAVTARDLESEASRTIHDHEERLTEQGLRLQTLADRDSESESGRREVGGTEPPIRAVGCSQAPTVWSVCFY